MKGGHGMSKQIDDKQLQTLGMLVDKAENYLAWATNPMSPADLKIDAMKTGLTEISEELKELYIELAGDNPWQVWRGAG